MILCIIYLGDSMKILVIFTGGTIGSLESGCVISPNSKSKRMLIDSFDNKYGVVFDETEPYFALSENNTGENLNMLINCVIDNMDKDYDGIIVAHGTDTLQYSASALSFALGADTIPVVIVSANYNLADRRSNGADNFAGAVDFIASRQGRGVFVSYKNSDGRMYIHRGSRLLAHNEFSDDLFSVKNQYFGIIDNGEFVKNKNYKAVKDEIKPFGRVNLDSHCDIKTIYAKVGEDFDYSDYNDDRIYLVKSYHSGTLPTADENFIKFVRSNNVFLSGFDKNTVYESAVIYEELGFNILPVSAFISSYIKLWLAHSKGLDLKEISQKSLGEDIIFD